MDHSTKLKRLIVACAQCRKQFSYYESECRPFCSERCQQIDLGHWLNEEYAVPSEEAPSADEDFNEDQ